MLKDQFNTQNHIPSVSSFQELVSIPFHGDLNAICWTRQLEGDFSEIVNKLELVENITVIEQEDLLKLQLSEQGKMAREIILNDLNLLKAHGASPSLNLIKNYDRDNLFPFFPTDVYSFHVDRSPIPTNTFLCTYFGESSEVLPNSQAEQKIQVPEIRAELKKIHSGNEEEFDSFLTEHFYDLHYQAKPNAVPLKLPLGELCRLAVDHPESKSLPCIHRAPIEKTGQFRLMLIC